jgi:uncharacterized ferritin-like protein (DUF455 family)
MSLNLYLAAERCLRCTEVGPKLDLAKRLRDDLKAGLLSRSGDVREPDLLEAGRPPRPLLVAPGKLSHRRIGKPEGQAALIHAVAHIEFNAINLACDAVYRFRDMPDSYYADWAQVAAEEAHHFSLLQERLRQLGYAYGDFPAHNGLWELAVKTAGDPLLRMALVPRVMEARGLDVTPGMIKRLRAVGDAATVRILERILREEEGHVAIGSRWYAHACAERDLDPLATFEDLIRSHAAGRVKPPLHLAARERAGFAPEELRLLQDLAGRR